MFTLPALLYLKLLPLFGQCLYHLVVPNKSRPPHAGGAALSPLVPYRPYTLLGFLRTACYLIRNEGGVDSEVFHVGSDHHGHDEVGSGHHGEVCGDDIHRVFLAREQHLYQSEVAWHREQLG
ncbi:hypothetical protein AVEN_153957-1 [Araneus ventricosus]|uniref:Secreted protein n=1 Tax=Araneus ventricosus TaxID=182803 RepID=A0A4Y2WHX5_ARAVE|nr:hypothetical protein AVEN_153957-1 [Araneus ventricosus]